MSEEKEKEAKEAKAKEKAKAKEAKAKAKAEEKEAKEKVKAEEKAKAEEAKAKEAEVKKAEAEAKAKEKADAKEAKNEDLGVLGKGTVNLGQKISKIVPKEVNGRMLNEVHTQGGCTYLLTDHDLEVQVSFPNQKLE